MSTNEKGFGMFSSTPMDQMIGKGDESQNATVGGGKTPQYVIKCPDLFDSDIEGMTEDATPCTWVETGIARLATFDSSGELTGDGKILSKDSVICMKYGSWGPLIQQYMIQGKKIEAISIYRLMSVNGVKIIIQQLNYGSCLIKKYEQLGDSVIFSFCFVDFEDLNISYDHDGKKIGQTGMKFNFASLKMETR